MSGAGRRAGNAVVSVASLEEFFRDSIDAAMESNRVVLDTHTTHYVVSLLTLFARSEALYEPTDSGPGLKPLAIMLADALEALVEHPAHPGRESGDAHEVSGAVLEPVGVVGQVAADG